MPMNPSEPWTHSLTEEFRRDKAARILYGALELINALGFWVDCATNVCDKVTAEVVPHRYGPDGKDGWNKEVVAVSCLRIRNTLRTIFELEYEYSFSEEYLNHPQKLVSVMEKSQRSIGMNVDWLVVAYKVVCLSTGLVLKDQT